MERHVELKNKSVFSFLKNQSLVRLSHDKILSSCKEEGVNAEIMKIKMKISELQALVCKDSSDLSEVLKQLEYYLSLGNNDKNLNLLLFNSKIFLQIVECVNISKQKYLFKLLNFIEKMLRGNKYIAKYLSKKHEFIRRILELMKNTIFFDVCIKICEEIFMNSHDLISISPFYKQIYDNYKIVEVNKLDSFCRILAIMIFDHKKIEFKQIFKYKEHLKMRPVAKVTTENQSIVYYLPKFLHKIVTTLK
jgi:hypothetical protein